MEVVEIGGEKARRPDTFAISMSQFLSLFHVD